MKLVTPELVVNLNGWIFLETSSFGLILGKFLKVGGHLKSYA